MPAPSPTAPVSAAATASRPAPVAYPVASSRSAMSQVRGDGQARPRLSASAGMWWTRPGRAVRKPEIAPRARAAAPGTLAASTTGTATSGHVPAMPRATVRGSCVHWRCTKRLASGGLRCQPSAALDGGFAAATMRTDSGNVRLPTRRSSTTRSSAACTAGGAEDNSSKNSSPWPVRASRTAQSGGAIGTPVTAGSSPTTGSPAKSDGSCTLAMTVSSVRPSPAASCSMPADLPMPGSPQSSTG